MNQFINIFKNNTETWRRGEKTIAPLRLCVEKELEVSTWVN